MDRVDDRLNQMVLEDWQVLPDDVRRAVRARGVVPEAGGPSPRPEPAPKPLATPKGG
jgi:hypothetical protein